MLAYLFVILAVAVRFMPHPLAFTPVGASLLFFGAHGPRRHLWVPFVLLAASDVILTKLIYTYPFTWDHFISWTWYAAMLWLGTKLRENARPQPSLRSTKKVRGLVERSTGPFRFRLLLPGRELEVARLFHPPFTLPESHSQYDQCTHSAYEP